MLKEAQDVRDGLFSVRTRILWSVFNKLTDCQTVRVSVVRSKSVIQSSLLEYIKLYSNNRDVLFMNSSNKFLVNINQLKPEFDDKINLEVYLLFADGIKVYRIDRLYDVPTIQKYQHKYNTNEWQFSITHNNIHVFDKLFLTEVISYDNILEVLK